MAFPPEFSSTATYANRYDLDEIDVFLEGDSNNPMFFNVSGLPDTLSFGKHFFNISLIYPTADRIMDIEHSEVQGHTHTHLPKTEYALRAGSKVLFEFKSINNVVLKSDVVKINQQNGMAVCFVEVLKDPKRTFMEVVDGEGTLTIAGSLSNTPNTRTPIPTKFVGAINYRCIFPINIRKNQINADSPFVLQSKHSIESIQGQFSFAKANISTNITSVQGTTYSPTTGAPSSVIAPPPGPIGKGSTS